MTPLFPQNLYDATSAASGVDGFDAVGESEVQQFFDEGFLVVENAFTPAETVSAIQGLDDLIAGKNADYAGIEYEEGVSDVNVGPASRLDLVRKFWRFVDYDERLKALSEHPAMISVLRLILHDTPEVFQDMALIKPPRIGREKPWHQDLAYFRLPIETVVVGAWIALDPALIENGCMRVIPGSHRAPVVHFKRRDWQICDRDVLRDAAMAVPLAPGGCLFFHGLLHHGTPPNQTSLRRRALQFHYKPGGAEWGADADRLRIFGGEGQGAQC